MRRDCCSLRALTRKTAAALFDRADCPRAIALVLIDLA
jgi:hypothetical protein